MGAWIILVCSRVAEPCRDLFDTGEIIMNHWDDVSIEDFQDDKDSTMSLLVEILGLEITKKVVEIFGGDSVYIPKAESVIRMGRDRRIYIEHKENGISYQELASRYNLTTRHVRAIINNQELFRKIIKEQQLDLF